MPKEDAYIDFLRIRKIPVTERVADVSAGDILPKVRQIAASDRDVYEKGKLAFVSLVRAYKEHQCAFIFQLKDVPLGRYVRGAWDTLCIPTAPPRRLKPPPAPC